MSKSSTVRRITVNEENSKKAAAFGIDVKEIDLQSVIKMGLEEVMFQAGSIAVQQLIEAKVDKLVGPRYSRTPGKAVHRWGEQKGLLYIGGQKININKPRVTRKKTTGGREEVELQTYKQFSKPGAMNKALMAKMLAYAGTVDEIIDGHGISRSAVSRRGVREAGKQLEQFYSRRDRS